MGKAFGRINGGASLSAGAYHGYMDSQGIPIEREYLEWTLTWGPAFVRGGIGAVVCGIGLWSGVKKLEARSKIVTRSQSEYMPRFLAVAGTGLGGIAGGAYGGIQTLVGYGIGYAVGGMMK